MSEIDLEDYYSAGYFLARKAKRPSYLDEPKELIPDEFISLESAFCTKVHLSWGWEPGNPTEAFEFGIEETKWLEFKAWCGNVDVEIWSMFRSTKAIRQFIEQFIPEPKREGFMIIGVGLHQSCEADWQEPYEDHGVEIQISRHLPIEEGGHPIGFDVSSYAHHNFDHTWLSHGHHVGVFEVLGIRPNHYALLETRKQAILARDYTNANDGHTYEYWLLVSYPLLADNLIDE